MKKGYTLMELLIVLALIMLICFIVLINIRSQLAKAHDGQRKTDLHKIQTSFEEYYNDKVTYPSTWDALTNCGGADLAPYLPKIPCDPITKKPYLYVMGSPTPKNGYVVCAKLENQADPDIIKIGCDPVKGCGWALGFNYCVASGMLAVAAGGGGGGEGGGGTYGPSPTPTPEPGLFACTKGGDCNIYDDPSCDAGGGCCPFTYTNRFCMYRGVGQCDDSANRCKSY